MTDLFSSQWFYIIIASFFTLILGTTILHLIPRKKKRKTKKKNAAATVPEKKLDPNDYNRIMEAVKQASSQTRCLLLAGNSLEDLPVTIPVNLAIKLAQTKKCLLIDLDTKRDAVSKVFDLNPDELPTNLQVSSLPTPVENLSVWPARNFEFLKQMNLRGLLEGANKKFDHILIYAPYLTTLADRKQIAATAKYAIAFTGSQKRDSRLIRLLDTCKCKVVQQF